MLGVSTNYDIVNKAFTSYLVYGLLRPLANVGSLFEVIQSLGGSGTTTNFSVPIFFDENTKVARPPK